MFKNQLFILIALSIFSGMTACQSDAAEQTTDTVVEAPATPKISFGRATFNEISKSCVTDTVRCAKATVSYPTVRGGSEAAIKKVNETIRNVVANAVGLYGAADSLQLKPREAAKNFVTEYDAFLAETPRSPAGWASETNANVLFAKGQILTIEVNTYAYSGGAHPNSYVNLLNFDLETGELLQAADMIQDTTSLKQMAEKAFRAEREMTAEEDLTEAGFWFEKGFTLPTEMGMTQEGLKLIYNPYEVAPYVVGATEFVIPNAKLGNILKSK